MSQLKIKERCIRNASIVYTISTGRTGTSALIKLLNLSNKINAYHEPSPLMGEMNVEAFYHLNENYNQYKKAFISSRFLNILRSALLGKVYAEHGVLVALTPLISEVFPKSKFIHIYRHPGDVIRSGMSRGWYNNHSWDKYRVSPLLEGSDKALWDSDWGAYEKNCWFWNKINDFGIHMAQVLPKERIIQIRFEDLFEDRSNYYTKIYDFLEVNSPNQDTVRALLSQKHNKQKQFTMPKFSDWSPGQKKILYSISGVTMKKLGYELL